MNFLKGLEKFLNIALLQRSADDPSCVRSVLACLAYRVMLEVRARATQIKKD